MKTVMIGTPCYSGNLDVWYTNSLCNSIKMSFDKDVNIIPMWVSFDALIQRARNDTVQIALEAGVDELIFIDADIEWQPEWLFKLIDYDMDVVGGTYPKKGDKEEYVVRQILRKPVLGNGLLEVDGLGTGFVKISKKAMQYLWDSSAKYIDPKDGKERRMIFDVVLQHELLVSEDIHAFNKLTAGGFKVYLDPTMTCNHTGNKKYQGNFEKWYSKTAPKKQL